MWNAVIIWGKWFISLFSESENLSSIVLKGDIHAGLQAEGSPLPGKQSNDHHQLTSAQIQNMTKYIAPEITAPFSNDSSYLFLNIISE